MGPSPRRFGGGPFPYAGWYCGPVISHWAETIGRSSPIPGFHQEVDSARPAQASVGRFSAGKKKPHDLQRLFLPLG